MTDVQKLMTEKQQAQKLLQDIQVQETRFRNASALRIRRWYCNKSLKLKQNKCIWQISVVIKVYGAKSIYM